MFSKSFYTAFVLLALSGLTAHAAPRPAAEDCSSSVSVVVETVTLSSRTPSPTPNNNGAGSGKQTSSIRGKGTSSKGSSNSKSSSSSGLANSKSGSKSNSSSANSKSGTGSSKSASSSTTSTGSNKSVTAAPATASAVDNGGDPATASAVDNSGGNSATATAVANSGDSATATATDNSGSDSAAGGSNNDGSSVDPQDSLELDPRVICDGFAQDGQEAAADPEPGQVAASTTKNNFMNLCLLYPNLPLTNGSQISTGSCNPAPIGVIPDSNNMPSQKFQSPKNLDQIPANVDFPVSLKIDKLDSGSFVNPKTNFLAVPQQVSKDGFVIGHTHIVMEAVDSLTSTNPTAPLDFTFFVGVNGKADENGIVTVNVTNGVPAGVYRMCTLITSSGHAPLVGPIAQHGTFDDCVYFTAVDNGSADGSGSAATASESSSSTSTTAAASESTSSAAGKGNNEVSSSTSTASKSTSSAASKGSNQNSNGQNQQSKNGQNQKAQQGKKFSGGKFGRK